MSDLIDRQAAFDLIMETDPFWAEGMTRAIFDGIKSLPAAQRWIPVTERLPEKNGRYLATRGMNACGALWNRVYILNYSDLMGLKSKRIWWNGNVGKSDFEHIDDVTAWMPLPKPYKKKSDAEIHN